MGSQSFRVAVAVVLLLVFGALLAAQGVLKVGDDPGRGTAAARSVVSATATAIPPTVGAGAQDPPPTSRPAPTVSQPAEGGSVPQDLPGFLPLKPDSASEAWKLTFDDEFNGSALDASRWTTHFWWGRTRDVELQYYVDDAVEVADGALTLRAEKRSEGGKSYTSGVVTTLGSFSQRYGFWEVRARTPAGAGLWPAVWLLPDAGNRTIWPPEIDLVEFMGSQPRLAHQNYHYANNSTPHGQASSEYQGPDFTAEFHTFGLQWVPNSLTWYVDGVATYRVRTDIPSIPMYLIMDLAIGDWGGQPNSSTPFPSRFQIDYVRVWQSDPVSSPVVR
ncbi:MAG TPA: glycoside hydrolase family 16 protein [Chloroflexota bacterium]